MEEIADCLVHLPPVDPGPDHGDGAVERLPDQRLVLADLVRRLADDEGARHVGVAAGRLVDREEIEEDDVVGADRTRAHVVPDRGLGAVRDDRLVGRGTVRDEGLVGMGLQELARHRLALEDEAAVPALGATEDVADLGHRGLRGLLRAADPVELRGGLHPPAPAEVFLVERELDAARAKVVSDTEGKALGNDRLGDAERATRPEVDLARDLVPAEAAPQELVDTELLPGRDLDAEPELLDTRLLVRRHHRVLLPAGLGVEERIGNDERYLVAHLG